MKMCLRITLAALLPLIFALPVLANEIEGPVEAIDRGSRTFKAEGITFHITEETDFDDFDSLEEMKVGHEVEVDFEYRDGKHFALEVEEE